MTNKTGEELKKVEERIEDLKKEVLLSLMKAYNRGKEDLLKEIHQDHDEKR